MRGLPVLLLAVNVASFALLCALLRRTPRVRAVPVTQLPHPPR